MLNNWIPIEDPSILQVILTWQSPLFKPNSPWQLVRFLLQVRYFYGFRIFTRWVIILWKKYLIFKNDFFLFVDDYRNEIWLLWIFQYLYALLVFWSFECYLVLIFEVLHSQTPGLSRIKATISLTYFGANTILFRITYSWVFSNYFSYTYDDLGLSHCLKGCVKKQISCCVRKS